MTFRAIMDRLEPAKPAATPVLRPAQPVSGSAPLHPPARGVAGAHERPHAITTTDGPLRLPKPATT